ncbi:hypothetical protein JCM12825_20400 [Desulfurobacterium crinifex]
MYGNISLSSFTEISKYSPEIPGATIFTIKGAAISPIKTVKINEKRRIEKNLSAKSLAS